MTLYRTLICISLSLMLLIGDVAAATFQTDAPTLSSQHRPKIGLVLSGGGARGAAHLGVIKALVDARVPIDCVAGTSIGGIVAALYATGYSPEAMDAFVRRIDWQRAFDDEVSRDERAFRRKADEELALLEPGIGFSEGRFKLRTGLVLGQNIQLVLAEIATQFPGEQNFDRFSVPLRLVATDIETGQAVVIGNGDLVTALRASMAVPGALSPVLMQDQLLVDGGVANNLPIDVVRELCADVVIAVDVGAPLLQRDQLQSAVEVTEQITTIVTRTNTDAQIAGLSEHDLLIRPDLGEIGSTDFSRFVDGIESGRVAAQQQQQRLQELALSASGYQQHWAGRRQPSAQVPRIAFYRIDNRSHVSSARVARTLQVDELLGEPLRAYTLNEHFAELYGTELFETVGYEAIRENNLDGIRIHVREKTWGPSYIQLRFLSDGDLRADSALSVGVDYLQTSMNGWDAEWRNFLQIGEEQLIYSEWYQPLASSNWFVQARALHQDRPQGLFNDRGDQLADFDVSESHLDLRFGYEIGPDQRLESGIRWGRADVNRRVGSEFPSADEIDVGEWFAGFTLDRLDDRFFPSSGARASIDWVASRTALGADAALDQLRVQGLAAFAQEKMRFLLRGSYERTLRGITPVHRRPTLGGFLNLSGVETRGLAGEHAALIAAAIYRQFDLQFLDVYFGLSLEYGNVFVDESFGLDDGRFSGSLWSGADTPLGPAYLGLGLLQGGDSAVFLTLGRPL